MESYISLGGIIILLALFAQKYIFGQRKIYVLDTKIQGVRSNIYSLNPFVNIC